MHTGSGSHERLQPFAVPFMALFERDRLPARSTLSRFLMALTEAPVEALRCLFLDDLLSRPLSKEGQTGGLVDREGAAWMVFDIDGTREAARQRALPQTEALPPVFRRLDEICAPGYTGRKRGEIVRTRTVISQAHTSQWLGSFGNRGNGHNPRGTAPGPLGHRSLPGLAPALAGARLVALRWTIWHGGCACRPGWLLIRDAGAVTTRCWIILWSRHVCTCHPISSSIVPKACWCAASTTVLMCQ